MNWRLNLQMAQSTVTKMKMPNAMFELGVQNENTQVGTGLNLSTYGKPH